MSGPLGGSPACCCNPLGGTEPPEVAITSPAPATLLAVHITATISGTCSAGCSLVELRYNGSLIGSCVPVGTTWEFKWGPGLLRAGAHDMVATAYRGLAQADSAPVSLTVDNVPLRALLGATGGFWYADDLAYANGATVATWASRVNGYNWTSSTVTMLTGGWVTPAGNLKCVSARVASLGEMNCDALAPLFQGTNPPVTVVEMMQVPAGLGSGTQMIFTATSTSSSTPKWLHQHVGVPAPVRLSKQTTTLTFSTAASLRVDYGQHLYVATDTGTAMNVARDSGCRQGFGTSQNLDVADGAFNTVNLFVQNNAGSKVNRADANLRALAIFPVASLTQPELQYLTNFLFGNFDHDAYYGDSAQPWEGNNFWGQSNTQGLAVSSLPDVPEIQFFFRSNNNWVSDPTALSTVEPQGAGPYIGYWYQASIDRQAAIPATPVHAFGFGSGGQYCNYFYDFSDDGYYSTTGFDEWCRNLETFKALMGGTPSWRVIWGQGESDATLQSAADVYQANLTTLMNLAEPRLSAGFPLVVIQLNGTSPGQTYAATVQAAEAAFVAGRAHTVLVPTTDIVFPTDFISIFHYDQTGQVIVGGRAGSAVVP